MPAILLFIVRIFYFGFVYKVAKEAEHKGESFKLYFKIARRDSPKVARRILNNNLIQSDIALLAELRRLNIVTDDFYKEKARMFLIPGATHHHIEHQKYAPTGRLTIREAKEKYGI